MTSRCQAPVSEDDLLDYWTRAIDELEAERVEEHLFSCGDCAARLETLVSIGGGLRMLVKQGRVAGVISRSLLNRMQRDGVHVRMYSLLPGERVPCARQSRFRCLVTRTRYSLKHPMCRSRQGMWKSCGRRPAMRSARCRPAECD